MFQEKKGTIIFYGAIAVIGLVVMIILRGFYQEKPMQAFTSYSPSVAENQTEEEVEKVEMYTFTDDNAGFSIGIPIGWVQASSDQSRYFVHRESGTGLYIKTSSYQKEYGNLSSSVLAEEKGKGGYIVTNVQFLSNSSYILLYGKAGSSGEIETQYIDYVTWDKETVVTLTYVCAVSNMDALFPAMQQSMDSFVWEKQNPIPADCYVQYYSYGDFEVGLPVGWAVGTTDTAVVANDTNSGAVLTIEAYATDEHIGAFTQNDYINFAMGNRQNFYLSSCSIFDDLLYAQASYTTESGIQMTLLHYIATNGVYEYIFTAECPAASFQDIAPTLNNCFSLFKSYAAIAAQPQETPSNGAQQPIQNTAPSSSSGSGRQAD